MQNTIRITEIFYSIQGESLTVGVPTVFIRLTGCPLRCQYCDTTYAFHGGERYTLPRILSTVQSYDAQYVCVTGGEPLAQPHSQTLLTTLCDAGYHVSLETSGAMNIALVDQRVTIVMDLKTPGSGEGHRNLLTNLPHLKPTDQIKFVICNRADYDWAVAFIQKKSLANKLTLLFSASWHELNATQLADWILADRLPVRLQTQLHKLLWQDERGR